MVQCEGIVSLAMPCFICLQDLHEEHAIQAFNRFDKDNSGYISAKDFEEIMISLKGYLLTPFVKEHLVSVSILSHLENFTKFCDFSY